MNTIKDLSLNFIQSSYYLICVSSDNVTQKRFFFTYVYMNILVCVCVVCVHECRCLSRPKKGVGSPEAS